MDPSRRRRDNHCRPSCLPAPCQRSRQGNVSVACRAMAHRESWGNVFDGRDHRLPLLPENHRHGLESAAAHHRAVGKGRRRARSLVCRARSRYRRRPGAGRRPRRYCAHCASMARMEHNQSRMDFPNLNRANHRITSIRTFRYNCIAWAAESNIKWWWPRLSRTSRSYWPPGVPQEVTLAAFIEAFRLLAYQECADGSLENGYQKIALYADASGKPTHAARQLPDGTWTSKLGNLEDIVHTTVDDVSGPLYGAPARFMRRPT